MILQLPRKIFTEFKFVSIRQRRLACTNRYAHSKTPARPAAPSQTNSPVPHGLIAGPRRRLQTTYWFIDR